MMITDDLLIEIGTEELPAKSLKSLVGAFTEMVGQALTQARFTFSHLEPIATPRRIGMIIHDLSASQPDQQQEKRGPALSAAFNNLGQPTPATQGFLKANQASQDALFTRDGYVWLALNQRGKSIDDILQALLDKVVGALPIPKPMRWGSQEESFLRPVHWLVVLYGDRILPLNLLGCQADRRSYGHRFHHPDPIFIGNTSSYFSSLEAGFVIPCFEKRRQSILQQITALARIHQALPRIPDALLDEVTHLVEWPLALWGRFNPDFLRVPQEALISAMEGHQKCFAAFDASGNLVPGFIAIANIQPADLSTVIKGNERVMHARLSDAAFFYDEDNKTSLDTLSQGLENIIFQTQLGTIGDKVKRIQGLAKTLAETWNADQDAVKRGVALSKADLLSQLVGEFPELQGIAGSYYALAQGELPLVGEIIRSHYAPRFAGDSLPSTLEGEILSIADRLDTLAGIFAIGQKPSGEKDPFGLRRSALGIVRILVEKERTCSLKALIKEALSPFSFVANPNLIDDLHRFILERYRFWSLERGISKEVFEAVLAKEQDNLADMEKRLWAIQSFLALPEAKHLAAIQKRVKNILEKSHGRHDQALDQGQLKEPAEQSLGQILLDQEPLFNRLKNEQAYTRLLENLVDLQERVDTFFEQVMINAPEPALRANRLALVYRLSEQLQSVGDISLLVSA